MNVLSKILELMKEHGLNQKQFTEKFTKEFEQHKVIQQTIIDWKKGTSHSYMNMICELADFFGVTTDYLYGREVTKSIVNHGNTINGGVQAIEYTSYPVTGVTAEILRVLENISTKDKAAVLAFVCDLEEKKDKPKEKVFDNFDEDTPA